MKINPILSLFLLIINILIAGCDKVLNKENLTAINADQVWNDPVAANAYLNDIYKIVMPELPHEGTNSDEAASRTQLPDQLKGTGTIDSWGGYWDYSNIRKINILLEKIESGTINSDTKKVIKGQAFFFRAWLYFGMVRAYGGVPIVLRAQNANEGEALNVPRNKTSECIAQIITDLDSAIAYLPVAYGSANAGRIDKIAARAFKGRVLLYYASPQFNPQGDINRWQNAYNANKDALDEANAGGKGLYENYKNIWYDDLNKEMIMYRRYLFPSDVYNQMGFRPIAYAKAQNGWDLPTLDLVNSFPLKDGSAYNPVVLGYDTLWKYRDDRFYASITYNGSDYGIKELVEANKYLWTYHIKDKPDPNQEGLTLWSITSFYRNKAIDKTVDLGTANLATVPNIEIRYAEVLLNLGEAANEIGKSNEALDALYQIRARAGILPGVDNKYGITASSKEDIRKAYIGERQVEFAFEDKRWWDLRRWRRFDILNQQVNKHGLYITKENPPFPEGKENINLIYDQFVNTVVKTDGGENINIPDNYYFYPLARVELDRNPNLKQTKGWDVGTFDPLE